MVLGAGAVGCYIGGRLADAGIAVDLVGRPRVLDAIRAQGLHLSRVDGAPCHVPAAAFGLHADAAALRDTTHALPALALLCTKSGGTAALAAEAAAVLPEGTPVLSLQNGVDNVAVAQKAAPRLAVLAGMVPFNVAELGPGRFHRGTSGDLAAQDHVATRAWAAAFARAGLPLALHADMRPVQWGKLLLNLNNPVNALSGRPLRAQLLQRDYRVVLAALQSEALHVMRAAGITPARLAPLPPAALPWVLRLPTPLFERMAARMLRVDEKARSSMADDMAAGRATEIDALCGAVVRLARSAGTVAPLNERILNLVVERHGRPLVPIDPRLLLSLMQL